jgi:hypothetical protein
MGGGPGGMGGSNDILSWVTATAKTVNYGGSEYTLYDMVQ